MSNATLYLIQSNYASTVTMIDQLEKIIADQDQVVFLGESVLYLNDVPELSQTLKTVHVLENEIDLLAHPTASHIQSINYAEFAELCLQYTRCVSMK